MTPASLSESFVEIFTIWQEASEEDSSTKVRLINSPKGEPLQNHSSRSVSACKECLLLERVICNIALTGKMCTLGS